MTTRTTAVAMVMIGLFVTVSARAQAPSPVPEPEAKSTLPTTSTGPFIVNDNSVSYHYEFSATNPGSGVTGKNVITFNHFDVWAYGTNLVNVDWLRATNGNTTPAAPCGFPNANTDCPGYTEWYGWEQTRFSTLRHSVLDRSPTCR